MLLETQSCCLWSQADVATSAAELQASIAFYTLDYNCPQIGRRTNFLNHLAFAWHTVDFWRTHSRRREDSVDSSFLRLSVPCNNNYVSCQHLGPPILPLTIYRPHIFVSVNREGAEDDTDIKDYEISLEFSIGDFKGLIEADTGLAVASQFIFFNGQPLTNDAQTLQGAGVKDQDMILVHEREPSRPAQSQPASRGESEADLRIEALRQQLLGRLRNAPQDRSQLQQQAPELIAALDDSARFREAFWRQQGLSDQRRTAELEALNNDMSEEGQAKIYEAIRQERVAREAEKAMEEHPERESILSFCTNKHALTVLQSSGE